MAHTCKSCGDLALGLGQCETCGAPQASVATRVVGCLVMLAIVASAVACVMVVSEFWSVPQPTHCECRCCGTYDSRR